MAKDKNLPMLNSERKEWQTKVTELTKEKDQIYSAALRKFNSIIIKAEYLTIAQREQLLEQLWSKE